MDVTQFLSQFEKAFGRDMAEQVRQGIVKNTERTFSEMTFTPARSKGVYAVFVVDQEADSVSPPDFVIATSEENARYKVLHSKNVADPETLDIFVQFVGTLKPKEKE